MRQHDPATPDSNPGCRRADLTDQNLRTRTRDALNIMMLGYPETLIPESLGRSRQLDRLAQRIRSAAPFSNWRLLNDGQSQLLVFGHESNDRQTRRSMRGRKRSLFILDSLVSIADFLGS